MGVKRVPFSPLFCVFRRVEKNAKFFGQILTRKKRCLYYQHSSETSANTMEEKEVKWQ